MAPLKALFKSEGVRRFLCWLGAHYIRLVRLTGRWTIVGAGPAEEMWDQGRPFVTAFWHGRILMMPCIWRRSAQIHMLISQHRDGQLIARVVSHFGIATVAGSSSKGGASALRAMLKLTRAGQWIGITPDGPRGPRMRASDGVALVARMAGIPVIPCGFSARRGKLLSSWDRFLVPWPFSDGVLIWGRPLYPPEEGDPQSLAAYREAIEAELNRITAEADRMMGRTPVEPAPPGEVRAKGAR